MAPFLLHIRIEYGQNNPQHWNWCGYEGLQN